MFYIVHLIQVFKILKYDKIFHIISVFVWQYKSKKINIPESTQKELPTKEALKGSRT